MFQCLRSYQLAEGNDRYLRAVQSATRLQLEAEKATAVAFEIYENSNALLEETAGTERLATVLSDGTDKETHGAIVQLIELCGAEELLKTIRTVQKHSVSKSSPATITPPASLIAVCKRYVSGVEDWQDWSFDRIVSLIKEGSSRVVALNNQIAKRSRQKNTENKVDYQEPGFSQQSLSLITPQKLPSTPERPRKPAPGRSETSEARSIRQSNDPTISNLRTQTTYLEQSILQLQESYDQLQVRRHILELESELYMTRLLYNHHFGLQIAEDEALKYSVKICNRIQPDASLVGFRRPKCAPIQLGDDFDDAGLRPVQHYTPQYLYVMVHDLPADIEDGIEVEMARKKAELHLLWLGTRVQNIMASGNQPAIAVMTACLNDIISYLPPRSVALAALFVMISALLRWSETIRKNVWINMQLHITTRNTISSTCWDLSTGMVSFCLVRVPWAHRSGRPIDIVDYQESQQTAVFAPTDSVTEDNPCRRFHRTSATSRHSHILCEVRGRLEPDQPE